MLHTIETGIYHDQHPKEYGCITPIDVESIVLTHKGLLSIIHETHSSVTLQTDASATQITCEADGVIWLLYKLRDRAHDGPDWMPSTLTQWPYNKNVDIFVGRGIEESTYWLDPRSKLEDVFTHEESEFIRNPFDALLDAHTQQEMSIWLKQWEDLQSNPYLVYPGYFARSHVQGLRRHILERSTAILKSKGYSHISAVPSWYHIAQIYSHLGFSCTYREDTDSMQQLHTALLPFENLSPEQKSWIVMLQFYFEKATSMGIEIDQGMEKFYLQDEMGQHLLYPLSPERNLWVQKAV